MPVALVAAEPSPPSCRTPRLSADLKLKASRTATPSGSAVPTPRAAAWCAAPARAVTLMELLLVLVLLVIAGSLAIPAITGAFSGVRLRRAGDVVIARWAEARAQAIETGVPYQFRFTPETGKYRLEPLSSVEQPPGAPLSQTSGGAAGPRRTATTLDETTTSNEPETSANQKSLDESPTIQSLLPEPILFVAGQTAVDDALRGERRVDALQTPASTWSTPILFFPDGSASTATIVLQNDVPQYLRVTLRGLTGVARASAVLTREEYDESSRTR